MSKQQNDNIGHVVCLMNGCKEHAAVRKNRTGKFYFDCPDHGRITPNLPEGQAAIMEAADIWGAGGPSAGCARWIAEQWPWGRVMRDPSARLPVNEETPVNEAPPVQQSAPVNRPKMPPPPPARSLSTEPEMAAAEKTIPAAAEKPKTQSRAESRECDFS